MSGTTRKNFITDISFIAVSRYSGIFVGILINAILARLLSPDDYGIVALATVFSAFFNLFTSMGIGPAIIQNRELTERDISNIFGFTFWMGLILAVIFFSCSDWIADFYKNKVLISICRWLSLQIFLSSLCIVPEALLSRQKLFKYIAKRNLSFQVFAGIISIVLAFKGFGVYTLLVSPLFTETMNFIVNEYKVKQKIVFFPSITPLRKIFNFSIFQFLFNLINFFGNNFGSMVIGKVMSVAAIGYYNKAGSLINLPVSNINGVITPVLFPYLVDYQSNKEKIFSVSMLLFVVTPFIIAMCDGGIKSRLDNYNLKYLCFFPLIYFLDEEKKMFNFLKSLLIGGMIVLVLAIFNFVKEYKDWSKLGSLDRVTAILRVQDFSNIMCIILLFLLSFLIFYKEKKENMLKKISLFVMILLVLFIVLVGRSKMVYVSLLPTIFYILLKKRKKYLLVFLVLCAVGYPLLPTSVTKRVPYIIKYNEDPSSKLRVIFWGAGIEELKEKPIYGWKALDRKEVTLKYYKKHGTLEYVKTWFLNEKFYKLTTQHYIATHNSYLQYLLDYGILGFAFFILVLVQNMVMLFKVKFYKNKKRKTYKDGKIK